MAKLKYALHSSKCLPEGLTTVWAKCVRTGSRLRSSEAVAIIISTFLMLPHSCKIQHCTDVNTLLVLWQLPDNQQIFAKDEPEKADACPRMNEPAKATVCVLDDEPLKDKYGEPNMSLRRPIQAKMYQ